MSTVGRSEFEMATSPENPYVSPHGGAARNDNEVSRTRGQSRCRVSWPAIAVCTVVGAILGAIFYAPKLNSPAMGGAAHEWGAILGGFVGLIVAAFLSFAIALLRNDEVG